MNEAFINGAGTMITFTDTQIIIGAKPKFFAYSDIKTAKCGMLLFEAKTDDNFIRFCFNSNQKRRLKELTKYILKNPNFFNGDFTEEKFIAYNSCLLFSRKGIEFSATNNTTETIPYYKIEKIDAFSHTLSITDFNDNLKTFPYNEEDKTRIKEAVNFVMNYIKTESPKKEYRMRCNVCGHIFCYTNADLKQNKENAKLASLHEVSSIANGLVGTAYNFHEEQKHADEMRSKIIDYSKCPKCNSKDISETNDTPEIQTKDEQPTTSTSLIADELKKFKELLDIGVITQEEFDAKKKQLLGL